MACSLAQKIETMISIVMGTVLVSTKQHGGTRSATYPASMDAIDMVQAFRLFKHVILYTFQLLFNSTGFCVICYGFLSAAS